MARQYLIPGWGYVNETLTRQYLISGWGYINESPISISVSGAITETHDAAISAIKKTISVSGAITEAKDTASGIVLERFRIKTIAEAGDAAAGTPKVNFTALAVIPENRDIAQGNVAIDSGFHVLGAITERGDLAAAFSASMMINNPIKLTGHMISPTMQGYLVYPKARGVRIDKISLNGSEQ